MLLGPGNETATIIFVLGNNVVPQVLKRTKYVREKSFTMGCLSGDNGIATTVSQ